MSRFRIHLAAPIAGLPVYFEREAIDRVSMAHKSLVAATEKHSNADVSNKEAELSKLHAVAQAARLALESARSYRYIDQDGTPPDSITSAAAGWINLTVEPTSETENNLVTKLCTLCFEASNLEGGGPSSQAFTPSLYLRAATTHFVVPNRLVTAFQDITSTA